MSGKDRSHDGGRSAPPVDPDPMPLPPRQPELDECCGSGCDPCVFDIYDAALERYEQALRAWRERHPDAPQGKAPG